MDSYAFLKKEKLMNFYLVLFLLLFLIVILYMTFRNQWVYNYRQLIIPFKEYKSIPSYEVMLYHHPFSWTKDINYWIMVQKVKELKKEYQIQKQDSCVRITKESARYKENLVQPYFPFRSD